VAFSGGAIFSKGGGQPYERGGRSDGTNGIKLEKEKKHLITEGGKKKEGHEAPDQGGKTLKFVKSRGESLELREKPRGKGSRCWREGEPLEEGTHQPNGRKKQQNQRSFHREGEEKEKEEGWVSLTKKNPPEKTPREKKPNHRLSQENPVSCKKKKGTRPSCPGGKGLLNRKTNDLPLWRGRTGGGGKKEFKGQEESRVVQGRKEKNARNGRRGKARRRDFQGERKINKKNDELVQRGKKKGPSKNGESV